MIIYFFKKIKIRLIFKKGIKMSRTNLENELHGFRLAQVVSTHYSDQLVLANFVLLDEFTIILISSIGKNVFFLLKKS
jgi:hypothetical protein